MRSKGLYKGLVKSFDTNNPNVSGQFFDIYKFYRNQAIRLSIPFYDPCCPEANPTALLPVGFNPTTATLSYFNPATDTVVTVGDSQSVTSLTAHAGGGQGSAVALTTGFNEVTTVATAADSVKLPSAAEGLIVTVKNDGAAAMDVFPATADKIDDGSVNAAVSVLPGAVVTFRAVDATNWESDFQVEQAAAVKVTGSGGVATDHITETTSGFGISLDKNTIQKRTATAVNVTGSVSATAIAGGLITSTSAAAVAATLDTATNIGTQIGAVQGTTLDFIVDNIAGSNTVTVTVNTGITAVTAVITGGATLTVGAGVAGQFRLYFTSATVAKLARIF